MPNHFHFMVRVREEAVLLQTLKLSPEHADQLRTHLSRKFSNLLNAYSKAYNKRFERRGSLFVRPFKRKRVTSEAYFTSLIAYIHNNPVHHNFVTDPADWPHSSWHTYLLEKSTRLNRQEGLDWFGGIDGFKKFHFQMREKDVIDEFQFD